MIVTELKALARDRWLRNYSQMRKAELVALLRNNPPPSRSRDPRVPPPQMSTWGPWKPIDYRRPRQPIPQEMDIFEQQGMSKSRPQIASKLNRWYDWLISHVPKPIKDGASKAFKLLRIRLWGCIIGLLVRVIRPRRPNGAQAPQPQNPNHLNQ